MQITYYPAGTKLAPQSPSTPVQEAVVMKIDQLPVELLEMIVYDLYDLRDLHALVIAYKRAYHVYLSDPIGVVLKNLRKSNVGGNQIQSLLMTTLLSRQPGSFFPGTRHLDEACQFFSQSARDHLLTLLHETADQDIKDRLTVLMGTMGPIAFLRGAASVVRNITEAEESLISTMLSKANVEIQGAMTTRQQRDVATEQAKMKGCRGDRQYLATFSAISRPAKRTPESTSERSWSRYTFPKVPPSATEIHRIRRAF
ncbi:MAG: hypothetical protein Q9221_009060 [Calogaya cf. arnoldii]